MSGRNKGGRKTLFTPEARKAIIQAVRGGASNADACNMAGISERALYEWLQIGTCALESQPHRRMPRDLALRADFAQFAQEYKIAVAQGNLARVAQIHRAGQDSWTHIRTGAVRFVAPPPLTWMDEQSGQIAFDDPTGVLPGQWVRQYSGEAWRHHRGEWQAAAWYLERTDPENWARRTTLRVEGGIDITVINGAIQALILLGHEPNEFFSKLRERAGLPPLGKASDG